MVYVFEGANGASVVFNGESLSDAQKAQAIVVENMPIKEETSGKIAILKADKSTEKVWYEYVDKPRDEADVLETRISDLELAITELLFI